MLTTHASEHPRSVSEKIHPSKQSAKHASGGAKVVSLVHAGSSTSLTVHKPAGTQPTAGVDEASKPSKGNRKTPGVEKMKAKTKR
jgi:hypothetical protein